MKRNPWPYAIILYFVVFIIAMTSWIVFAVRHDQQLVSKDYYEKELKFQTELDSLNRAKVANLDVIYKPDSQLITFTLPADASGAIHFYRPSDAKLDREVKLTGGAQTIDAREFASGLWKMHLSWKANASEYRQDETLIIAAVPQSEIVNRQSSIVN